MQALRRRVGWLTIGWLLCQAVDLSASPVVMGNACVARADVVPECCRNLKPGQTCPMHPKAAIEEHECRMGTTRSAVDASLLPLVAGFGAAPRAKASVAGIAPAGVIDGAVVSLMACTSPPELQPPRA